MTSTARIAEQWAARGGSGLPPIAGASPIQSEQVIGFGKESVFGTFVGPTKYVPAICTVNPNQKVVRPVQSRGTRSQVVDVVVGFETECTITGELVPEVWPALLAGAFGSGSDTYTQPEPGASKHVLVPRPQCPYFSVELATDVIEGERVLTRQLTGGVVDRFQLKATNQAIINAEAQIIAQREILQATPGLVSSSEINASITTVQPMDFSLIAFTYKGTSSTQLKDATIALLNKTQRIFSSNQKLYAARLVPTLREITLSMNLDFLDAKFFTDWFEGTKTSGIVLTAESLANISGTATKYKFQFTLPGIRAMGAFAMPAAADVIEQQLQYSVTLSGTNEISAEVINAENEVLA